MLPPLDHLRRSITATIKAKHRQGHDTVGLEERLAATPASYDALWAFAQTLVDLPIRGDWQHVEPSDWVSIEVEAAPGRPRGLWRPIAPTEAAVRAETGFLGSVCACMVGKPLEINPTLAEIRAALEEIDEWPLRDYVSLRTNMRGKHEFHPDHPLCVRENLRYAAPDDDINYTVLGLMLLEQHGPGFTHGQLGKLWLCNIPPLFAWGPERNFVARAATRFLYDDEWRDWRDYAFDDITSILNPGDEACGAMIRADAYGYAAPGRPELAAWLAWKDASLTHRRTGIYGTIFAAAAISAAFVARDPLEIFEVALKFVPQRSRFFQIVSDCLSEVRQASDWLDGYQRIHAKYGQYGHCAIYQESGTLINTLRFAEDIGDGFCKQVMQGNDTDSYGATAGAILGAYLGPGRLEPRWLAPLHDTLHTTLADFHEQSLSKVAARIAALPTLGAAWTGKIGEAASPSPHATGSAGLNAIE